MKFDKTKFYLAWLLGVIQIAWPVAISAQTAALGEIEDKFGPVLSLPPAQNAPVSTSDSSVSATPESPNVSPTGEELVYLNATDVDIKDMIKQISKATGTNFLLDDKVRGKVTIISEKPMTKDMAYQAFLSALQVMGFTTVRTPGGLTKIVDTKEAINAPIDLYKNDSPNTDQFITRIIQVKNISANELSTVIKSLISKEGNLFAYPATNSIILTDAGSNIDRILKIIRELDQEGPQEVIEIIPIQNANASDITEKILQLFEDQVTSAGGQAGGTRGSRTARRGQPQSAELEEAPSISKVISDERTNSVIVLGSKRAIIKVRGLISRLDSNIEGAEGTIHVYYLKHANAKDLAEVLGGFVSDSTKSEKGSSKKASGDSTNAGAPKTSAQLEGGVKVTADEGTNSLVITASPKDYETLIERVISKLDIPRRQVYLEAVVMELSVAKSRTLGLSGNFGNVFNVGGENISAFGALPPLAPNVFNSIATGAAGAGGLTAGGFSERAINFTLPDGSSVAIPAVSAFLQAIQTDSDVNILSTPSILTLDNEEATIQVGSEVPVSSGQSVTSGISQLSISREDVGVILKITPQISESDTVRLELAQEVSSIGANDPTFGPTFNKKKVETVVVAQDKQTIVIGGLIDDRATVSTNKIPLVGDIPVVGSLFKNRNTQKSKQNLLVFITPYIIRDRADFMGILEKKVEERNLFIDLNYGMGQRKAIRQSIKNHAGELLEYKSVIHKNSKSEQVSMDTSNKPVEESVKK